MRTAAILPLKGFAHAKSRLAEGLTAAQRAQLAQAMAADVLATLERSVAIAAVIAVCADDDARSLAAAHGADVVAERLPGGQSAAVMLGIARASQDGFERVLCLPGDCPALSADDLHALTAPPRSPAVTIVPDRHGTGTNALLLTPVDVIAPSFGEGSFARHCALARAAGVEPTVAPLPALALDVDTPSDLAELTRKRALLAPASRTRGLLEGTLAACAATVLAPGSAGAGR